MADPVDSLRTARTVAAPPERLFVALTDAAQFARWFRPDGFDEVRAEIDARPGGRLLIELRPPGGAPLYIEGTFREVDAPRRISFTWSWRGGPFDGLDETVVSIELRPVAAGTELLLEHRGFLSAEERAAHLKGWDECLAGLVGLVESFATPSAQ